MRKTLFFNGPKYVDRHFIAKSQFCFPPKPGCVCESVESGSWNENCWFNIHHMCWKEWHGDYGRTKQSPNSEVKSLPPPFYSTRHDTIYIFNSPASISSVPVDIISYVSNVCSCLAYV